MLPVHSVLIIRVSVDVDESGEDCDEPIGNVSSTDLVYYDSLCGDFNVRNATYFCYSCDSIINSGLDMYSHLFMD